MRREAQALVLLVLGGGLLRLTLDGTVGRWVRPGLSPLVGLTGVALVGLAAVTLWLAYGRRGRPVDDDTDRGVVHGWPVLVLLLALVVVAPPGPGAWWAGRSATTLAVAPPVGDRSVPPGSPVRLSIAEYAARALADRGASLAGREVTLTGFVVAGPAGTPYLTRLVLGCCAAGARPVTVGLTGILPDQLAPGRWIEVDGTVSPRQDRDPVTQALIAYLDVEAVRAIDPPAQPYDLVG